MDTPESEDLGLPEARCCCEESEIDHGSIELDHPDSRGYRIDTSPFSWIRLP